MLEVSSPPLELVEGSKAVDYFPSIILEPQCLNTDLDKYFDNDSAISKNVDNSKCKFWILL